jgi:hypothetical protein
MAIKLEVPLVPQDKSMSCWYASACMVAYYYEAGPRLGLPKRYAENQGVNPTVGDFVALAKAEHLTPVIAANRAWGDTSLERALRDFGPIWCAGYWYGPGHIVVLTGVENGSVLINDPDGGVKKTGTLAWFNSKLAKMYPECLLRRER